MCDDPLDVHYGLLHALSVDTKRNSRIKCSKLGEPAPEGWVGGAFGAVLDKSRNIFGSETKLEKVNRTGSGYTSQLSNTTKMESIASVEKKYEPSPREQLYVTTPSRVLYSCTVQ